MAETFSLNGIREIAQDALPKGSRVWLYGSRSRGDGRSDSDWDLLVLINKPSIDSGDFDAYGYPLIEYGWHFGANVSPQLYTLKEWDAMQLTPYHINVERDKKVIYES